MGCHQEECFTSGLGGEVAGSSRIQWNLCDGKKVIASLFEAALENSRGFWRACEVFKAESLAWGQSVGSLVGAPSPVAVRALPRGQLVHEITLIPTALSVLMEK